MTNNLAVANLLEMKMSKKNLGDLLIEYNLITQSDLTEALNIQHQGNKKRIGEILVELGKVTEEDIQYLISKQLDIPFIFLRDIKLDNDLIKKFSRDFLVNNRIIPLYETADLLSVATNDPFNSEAINKLKEFTGKDISVSACSSKDILQKLKSLQNVFLGEINEVIKNLLKKLTKTSFYRLDFIFRGKLTINIFGTFTMQTYTEIDPGNITVEDIFKYFENLEHGFFYEKFNYDNGFLIQIYPVIETKNISFINEFGVYPDKFPIFTDTKYAGNLPVFQSDYPVPGYAYISFKKYSEFKDAINVIDNLHEKLPENYLACTKCKICSGSKCDECNNLGYTFEVKNG